jgi:hypothetical protein
MRDVYSECIWCATVAISNKPTHFGAAAAGRGRPWQRDWPGGEHCGRVGHGGGLGGLGGRHRAGLGLLGDLGGSGYDGRPSDGLDGGDHGPDSAPR